MYKISLYSFCYYFFFLLFYFLEKGRPEIICNDSNATCYHKDEQTHIIKDETKCNSVNENREYKCFIALTTQIYTGFDRGK